MTQRGKDYYHILGVPEGASMDEIKRAYRRLARQYHPDVYKAPDAEKKFKEINEAYQTLSDPEKRAQYDYFRQPGAEVFRGFPGFGFEEAFRGFEEFGDIFNIFFGRAGPTVTRRARGQRGDDLRYDLSITLEEVSSGVEKEIEIEHLGICPKCGGSGAEPGTEPSRCSTCHGTGEVRKTQRTLMGTFTQIVTCPTCRGAGETIVSPCYTCKGNGRVRETHKVKIKIPAGVESGHRLKIPREGNAGIFGGPPGDLYIFLKVKPHKFFERQNNDLLYKLKISFIQAILGDKVEVPTIDGKTLLEIPAGTQPNTVLTLRGRGIPHFQGRGKGDLQVIVEVEIPSRLTKEQQELLKRWHASS